MINISVKTKGFLKLIASKVQLDEQGLPIFDSDGNYIELSTRELTGWFPNKLLTTGRNRMGTASDWLNACQVGTDNTAPVAGQTGLLGYTAGTTDIQETLSGAQGSAPYYGWKRRRFRFAVGTTAANLSEVGVGWSHLTGSFLYTRALIVDIDGDPTTVTPLSDEILDVWYELRYYPPEEDATGTVELNGIDYTFTVRASEVTNSEWGSLIGNAIGEYSPNTTGTDWRAWDGAIGAINLAPSGSSIAGTTDPANDAYSNNSYQRRMVNSCGAGGWNLGLGIRCITIKTTAGRYQTQFAAVSGGARVPKTSGYTMFMAWIISWEEAVIP